MPQLAVELLCQPSFRLSGEWRWGHKGSLCVVIAGSKAGMWFDHEAGEGGGFVYLVSRDFGLSRGDALDWTGDRIGMGQRHPPLWPRAKMLIPAANAPVLLLAQPEPDDAPQAKHDEADPAISRTDEAGARAARIWAAASSGIRRSSLSPAQADRPASHGLRVTARGQLVVPLQDTEGVLLSLETIGPDGAKRFLAGGAKRGHFCVIGVDPTPFAEAVGPLLICEGWATGASLAMATGHTVIAAMDAGNLLPVAEALRARFPGADLILVADNDAKPDRDTNTGVEAARKAALAVDARIAIPVNPGDANDLFCAEGPEAVATLICQSASNIEQVTAFNIDQFGR